MNVHANLLEQTSFLQRLPAAKNGVANDGIMLA